MAEQEAIFRYLIESRNAIQEMVNGEDIVTAIHASIDSIVHALRLGHKVLIVGNGGSAADAQHIVAELMGRFDMERPGLPAIALAADSSVLTALGNDYGYEAVFERQVRAMGNAGDILWALSTSGKSPNVLRAVKAAREQGMIVIGFTSISPGADKAMEGDVCLRAPSTSTPIIQQVHMVAAHLICGEVEAKLFAHQVVERAVA